MLIDIGKIGIILFVVVVVVVFLGIFVVIVIMKCGRLRNILKFFGE